MSSGATSAWKLFTPTVSKTRDDPGQVDLPGLHVLQRAGLVQRLAAVAPGLLELDRERPAQSRPTSSLAAERIGRRAVVRVRQGEDARLRLLGSTGLVAARAAARSQGIADTASTAAIAHRMNRLGCIVVHLR